MVAGGAPITHRTLTLDGGLRMHVAEAGAKGPLVVLLHGWPDCWYSWRHQLPALAAAGYRAVAPDQRGCGETDVPPHVADYTIEHLVGDVTALIEALGETRAILVGHDLGALVAWDTAKKRPERVAAVAALNMPDRFAEPSEPYPRPVEALRTARGDGFFAVRLQRPGADDAALTAEFERDPQRLVRRVLYTGSGESPVWHGMIPDGGTIVDALRDDRLPAWASEDDVKVYAALFERSGFTGGLNWFRNMDSNWELSEPWRANPVEAPAMFLIGDREGDYGSQAMLDLLSGRSGSVPDLRDALVLAGCGHWIHQERPEEVNEALIEFLGSL
ncbi:alpha/beta hydrolase [Nonomuraea deserti]|uniref:Alpha/beta hydrolase n=1 Tax=Nonomuraea deserti TaxID=1848322 RepID=A0A4R4V0Y5_9ACTN|nr:alpha/beta hydrolase [Nonomuraea deserti]TDC98647.1 alpha/beta hydrolase [Nonomuraea deserti]